MRITTVIVLTSAVAAGTAASFAQDDRKPPATVNEVFGAFGFTTSSIVNVLGCRVVGTLDEGIFVTRIPALQRLDLLNRELKQAEIDAKPTTLAVAFTMQMEPAVTKETFDLNSHASVCAFIYNLRGRNRYGHAAENKILSYTFDRKTYEKINWETFKATNMAKVAQHFMRDPAMMARLDGEARSYLTH